MSHGWFQLAPWNWDPINHNLSRIELCRDGYLKRVICGQVNSKSISIQIPDADLTPIEKEYIKKKAERWFSFAWDPTEAIRLSKIIDPEVSRFIENGGGRFLRGSSFYEDCIKTILTINANWKFTVRMAADISMQLGEGGFPNPLTILKAGPIILKKDLRLGFRAEVIYQISRQLLDRGIIDERGMLKKPTLGFEDLIQFRGLGPYTVNHILMLLHNFEWIPIDSEVTNYCQLTYKLKTDEIQEYFAPWGKYRFLGYKLRRIIDS